MNGLADQEDLRLRFDVLTKTKQPEFRRYWITRDRAANRRLFRLVAEVIRAVEAGVFHPNPGPALQGSPLAEPVLGVGGERTPRKEPGGRAELIHGASTRRRGSRRPGPARARFGPPASASGGLGRRWPAAWMAC